MTVQTPPQVVVGAMQVAYTESGTGEPLILVHGGESDRTQFTALRPFLGAGIRAISYDQRDTGDTVNPGDPYTIDDLGTDLADLVGALGYERAHLFGTSYGGIVAMHAALGHPERFASLSLAACAPNADFGGPGMATLLQLDPEERRGFMVDMLITPRGQADDPGLLDRARSVLAPRTPEQNARRMAAVSTHDVLDALAGLSVPTLLIHGTDDPLIRVEAAEEMARRIPGSRLELIDGGRHGIATEFPQLVAGVVREFVHGRPAGR
ncbi:alpha/beta fold hydrolase [Streptomyces sp. NBC_01716]|uniref:alpha/beta fold hydrolase n=1 Tax=Streptomyces sp. NBC_01716 TaxID=2975917 RepID=UPI002E32B82E|nr:alpha/beta hydrolase [Streptomyces sp. NBC_01716]